MKRLTTDRPESNFETVLNFVYGKDGAAYLRSDGEQDDVPLHEWAKKQCIAKGCGEFPGETLEEIDQTICDCGFDFPDCPVHLAYIFACQAVHLRDRLKMYEDTGLMPDEIDSIFINGVIEENRRLKDKLNRLKTEPNAPLTLAELREMDGDKIYIRFMGDYEGCAEIFVPYFGKYEQFIQEGGEELSGWDLPLSEYGAHWLAYRRKPEEGTVSKKEVEQHEKV